MSDLRERAAIAAMVGLIQNKPVKGVREQMQDVIASVAVQHADALLAELARTAAPKVDPGPRLQCNACMGTGVPGAVVTQHGYPQRCEVCGGSGYYAAPKDEPSLRCTAAERELIEASISSQITNNFQPWYAAIEAVRAERRAASEAKGGEQP